MMPNAEIFENTQMFGIAQTFLDEQLCALKISILAPKNNFCNFSLLSLTEIYIVNPENL